MTAAQEPEEHGPEGYTGPVTCTLPDGSELTAEAALAARFDPLAGHTAWRGRVAAELPVPVVVVVGTPFGQSRACTTERDVWGNTRVSGLDRPPFPVELLDAVD